MPLHVRVYVAIFALSGFAGLIYESIWSHYLKLLLGHAAYAQTLVLSIFMGGMAVGSWLASRLSLRWRDLLLAYAVVELIIGALALGFHPGFLWVADWLQLRLLPGIDGATAINLAKWTVSAALILPQTVLLGMTFPLMTAGVLRVFPHTPGHSIASLYFANSFGAAIGVLASGFWLIDAFGLPGTMLTAGLLNFLVAGFVWLLTRKHHPVVTPQAAEVQPGHGNPMLYRGMLLVALVTGMASFIYELSWIRMLSMVLGAATHSFELMLSAFIFGLALGGLWVRRRIDRLANAPGFLGVVQILMGCFALLSLAMYGRCFELMSWLLAALQKTDNGYTLFVVSSHVLALLIMLPATFCAGMTLPLITFILLRAGVGERSIGTVYAANTIGAIIGVLLTVHLGMPLLGLKFSMLAGATLDIVLGIAILASAVPAVSSRRAGGWSAVGVGVAAAVVLLVRLDPYQMASGVYRYGRAELSRSNEMLFHRDGKTATINLIRTPEGRISIMTNGKPDAAITMTEGGEVAPDEPTMVLAAAIPLALRPEAKTAANIGMGSGLTTSTLLASDRLEQVDTIEIEAAMIEAANGFRPRVERAYTDPRGTLHVEDAKTFFGARKQRYDIIVSEPSNPWVSGVASLFSTEFYDRVKRYLTDDGVLVQWLQLYEIDLALVASVVNALSQHFPNYTLYYSDNANVLFVASFGQTDVLGEHVFEAPDLRWELEHVGVNHLDDLRARRVTDRSLLEPLLASYNSPSNSDYFPYLDRRAARTRFLGRDAAGLTALAYAPLPIVPMLDGDYVEPRQTLTRDESSAVTRRRASAAAVARYLVEGTEPEQVFPEPFNTQLQLLRERGGTCDAAEGKAWTAAAFRLANETMAHSPPSRADEILDAVAGHACLEAEPRRGEWLALFRAVGRRDASAMQGAALSLLEHAEPDNERFGYLVASAMLGAIADGRPDAALDAWAEHGETRWSAQGVNVYLRTLLSTAVYRAETPLTALQE